MDMRRCCLCPSHRPRGIPFNDRGRALCRADCNPTIAPPPTRVISTALPALCVPTRRARQEKDETLASGVSPRHVARIRTMVGVGLGWMYVSCRQYRAHQPRCTRFNVARRPRGVGRARGTAIRATTTGCHACHHSSLATRLSSRLVGTGSRSSRALLSRLCGHGMRRSSLSEHESRRPTYRRASYGSQPVGGRSIRAPLTAPSCVEQA
jgi:hypothetical protein